MFGETGRVPLQQFDIPFEEGQEGREVGVATGLDPGVARLGSGTRLLFLKVAWHFPLFLIITTSDANQTRLV